MYDPLPPVAILDNAWGSTLACAASLGAHGVPLDFYGDGCGRWSRYARSRRPAPSPDDVDRFQPWLRDRLRSGEIARVVPTTDLLAWHVAALRDDFPDAVRRTIPPLDAIETCLIKPRFHAHCHELGLGAPLTVTPVNAGAAMAAARDLGFPLLLKPRSHLGVGFDERGALVRTEPELRRCFARLPVAPGHAPLLQREPDLCWPMLQQYLPAARRRVYSVTGLIDADHGVVMAAVSFKQAQSPRDIGTSTVQRAHVDAAVLDAGLRVVRPLLRAGLFEVELVEDDGTLKAIDLNPRAFGFITLDMARGSDLPWLWYRSTLAPLPAMRAWPQDDDIEARHVVPYVALKVAEWRSRALRRRSTDALANPPPARRWVSMLGSRSDPMAMLWANALRLRRPGSTMKAWRTAQARAPEAVES